MPISANNSYQRVTLYLGDGGKDAVQLKTDIMSALGSYVHRAANSSKSLHDYPLVFTDKIGLKNFLAMRNSMTRESDDLRPLMSGEAGQDVGAHFIHALRTVRAVGADDFIFSAEQKIYIVGHGSAGLDRIAVDDKEFTMSDIANVLVDIGVPRDIQDIRLTSCHSASATAVPDLNASDLSTYSRPVTEKSSFMGIPWGSRERKAPAEYLSDALAEKNFNRVTVTGYHGAGIHYDGIHFPEHKIRNTKIPSEPGYEPSATVRRSSVAQKFTSEIDY